MSRMSSAGGLSMPSTPTSLPLRSSGAATRLVMFCAASISNSSAGIDPSSKARFSMTTHSSRSNRPIHRRNGSMPTSCSSSISDEMPGAHHSCVLRNMVPCRMKIYVRSADSCSPSSSSMWFVASSRSVSR